MYSKITSTQFMIQVVFKNFKDIIFDTMLIINIQFTSELKKDTNLNYLNLIIRTNGGFTVI